MDLNAFLDYWRGRIEKDLIPFADPGTQLEISGDKRTFTAHWVARGQAQDAVFTVSLVSCLRKSLVLRPVPWYPAAHASTTS